MIYAIPTENGSAGAHFGRCPEYTFVEVQDGNEISRKSLPNPGHHPGAIPQFLKDNNTDAVLAGGMGKRARDLFDELGIKVYFGCSGTIDSLVESACQGTLNETAENSCAPGQARGYGIEKTVCDH